MRTPRARAAAKVTYAVLVLAVEAELVLRLAVGDLVVAVPLVDLGQQTGLLALNVGDVCI